MQQQASNYTARGAISNALKAYEAAVRARQQQEQQAQARRDAELQQAKASADQAVRQAQSNRTAARDQVNKLQSEVLRLCQEADRMLADVQVPCPTVTAAGITAPNQPLQIALMEQHRTAKGAHSDLRNAVQELIRVRQTLTVRLCRALHLPQ